MSTYTITFTDEEILDALEEMGVDRADVSEDELADIGQAILVRFDERFLDAIRNC